MPKGKTIRMGNVEITVADDSEIEHHTPEQAHMLRQCTHALIRGAACCPTAAIRTLIAVAIDVLMEGDDALLAITTSLDAYVAEAKDHLAAAYKRAEERVAEEAAAASKPPGETLQ